VNVSHKLQYRFLPGDSLEIHLEFTAL
jgi:hypothetical protein